MRPRKNIRFTGDEGAERSSKIRHETNVEWKDQPKAAPRISGRSERKVCGLRFSGRQTVLT
jgi:hypothetical protein